MELKIIFSIFITHWIADFIMQDEKWALGKSKNWKDLLSHTGVYSFCWIPFAWYFLGHTMAGNLFILITFMCHTATDYFTSRVVSKMFTEKKHGSPIPNVGAFTVIGFDQVLHYTQLFLTFHYLSA
jgi:hypothetical protein